jgi:hypothetical protein
MSRPVNVGVLTADRDFDWGRVVPYHSEKNIAEMRNESRRWKALMMEMRLSTLDGLAIAPDGKARNSFPSKVG